MIKETLATFQEQQFCAPILFLSVTQKNILNKLINSSTIAKSLFLRAKIILLAAQQSTIYQIIKLLKIEWKTVKKWIGRWLSFSSAFSKIQNEDNSKLIRLIASCLADAPRRGRSLKFTQEQVLQIFNIACTAPKILGVPLSHWSSRSLAKQVIKMNIVSAISHEKISFF